MILNYYSRMPVLVCYTSLKKNKGFYWIKVLCNVSVLLWVFILFIYFFIHDSTLRYFRKPGICFEYVFSYFISGLQGKKSADEYELRPLAGTDLCSSTSFPKKANRKSVNRN